MWRSSPAVRGDGTESETENFKWKIENRQKGAVFGRSSTATVKSMCRVRAWGRKRNVHSNTSALGRT